jgi:hypothetical protein
LTDQGVGKGFRGDLRYCINKVNDQPGADTIDFLAAGTIELTGRLPVLSTDIAILGPGADLLTIRRDTGGDYRILAVGPGANVDIADVTITNGKDLSGGGILNQGNLSLMRVVVASNMATADWEAWGGGIHNDRDAFLVADHCTIRNNSVFGLGVGYFGGGIFNEEFATAVVSYSVLAENIAGADDPGVPYRAEGGGIYNRIRADLQVEGALFEANSVRVSGSPGAWFSFAVGGGVSTYGTTVVSNSTFAANSAASLVTGAGALYSRSGGGGIYVKTGHLTISSSTIAWNQAIGPDETYGGGLYVHVVVPPPVYIANSIFAYNSALLGPDLYGKMTNSVNDLFSHSAGGINFGSFDKLDVDPLLGPLTNNGGSTKTFDLLPGSPAQNAGDNSGAPEWDQRGPGFNRIAFGQIDMGALEVQDRANGAAADRFFHAVLAAARWFDRDPDDLVFAEFLALGAIQRID